MFALFLIALKGGAVEGQSNLFTNLVGKYVEETAVSISSAVMSHNGASDLNSLAALYSLGHGGSESEIALATVQGNSFVSHSPVVRDYADTGFKSNQVIEYTVQAGDVLSFIASDFGVSTNSIIWVNNLANAHSIKPGQVLRIPPVTGVVHKVKQGDNVSSIAKAYDVEEQKIIEFNRLGDNAFLTVGEEVVVPGGVIKTVASTAKPVVASQRFSHLPNLGDYFIAPTTGRISQGIHGRNAIDIANAKGASIYAAAAGVVTIAQASGYNGGYGLYVKISHSNGTQTLYAHLDRVLTSVGQTVSKGQKIGTMGNSGRVYGLTGVHLHFEVHGARNPLVR